MAINPASIVMAPMIALAGGDGARRLVRNATQNQGRPRKMKIFFAVIPVPEQFYARYKDLELINTRRIIGIATAVLYAAVVISFAVGLWFYYNIKVNHTLVSAHEWSKPGYDCKPLSPDEHYGNTYTYEECQANYRPVSEESIDFTKRAVARRFANAWKGDDSLIVVGDGYGSVSYNPFATQNNEGLQAKYLSWQWSSEGSHDADPFIQDNRGGWTDDDAVNSAANLATGKYIHLIDGDHFVGICAPSGGSFYLDALTVQAMTGGIDCTTDTLDAAYKATWVAMFEKVMETYGDVCHYTYENRPYLCTKTERHHWLTIIALANNISALLYTFLAIALIKILMGKRTDRGETKSWVKRLPLPPELYNERYDLTLVTGDQTASVLTTVIFVVTAGSFLFFFYFYSAVNEVNYTQVLTREYEIKDELKDFECFPTDSHNGFMTSHSYDECVEDLKQRPPSASTVAFQTNDGYSEDASKTRVYSSMWMPFTEMENDAYITESNPWNTLELIPGSYLEDMTEPTEIAANTLLSFGVKAWTASGTTQKWFSRQAGFPANVYISRSTAWSDDSKAAAIAAWVKIADHIGDKLCDYTKEQGPYQCHENWYGLDVNNLLNSLALAFGLAQLIYAIQSYLAVIFIAERNRMSTQPIRSLKPERTWLSRIPVPEKFYELNALDLISKPSIVLAAFMGMVVVGALAFYFTYVIYDAQRFTEMTIVDGYELDGYTCKPTATARYGSQTAGLPPWTYAECVAKLEAPTVENSGLNDLSQLVSGAGTFNNYPDDGCARGACATTTYNASTYSTPFDQPVRFAPWGKALPGFDWYRGCTSDCEPSCQWTSTVGDVRYDWGQAYNCKHGVKTWDAPYASFDAYFSAKMTAWKSSFDGSGLTLENDPRFGIYVKYANAAPAAKKESEVVAQFTTIYQTLGEEGLCAWTNDITPQACEKETKNDVLTVLSLAFANAELAAMTWITLIPIFIISCCGRKSTYRERVEVEAPPKPKSGPMMFLVPTPSSKEDLEARQRAEREAAERHNAERKAAEEAAKLEKKASKMERAASKKASKMERAASKKASKMERAASKKKPKGEDPSNAV